MNVQPERCDRTAYVSGLQPTVTDIELFELFNRVAHVEKVIVRSGSVRHALVVFKTVDGLYQALHSFQGATLHSRQLHIRPLRESSHNNNSTNGGGNGSAQRQSNYQKTSSSYRPSSANDHHQYWNQSSAQNQNYYNQSSSYQPRGSRVPSNTYQGANGQRRRYGYNNRSGGLQNETYPLSRFENRYGASSQQQYSEGVGYRGHQQQQYHQHHQNPAHQHDFHFEDYTEGAKRFDNLANLIRATTPTDPLFVVPVKKSSDISTSPTSSSAIPRSRTSSSTTYQKVPPPAWKMELPLMKATDASHKELSMGQQEFLAQIARQAVQKAHDGGQKKKQRPNLSVINPSLFYEQYPRTSSPVVKSSAPYKAPSPHDPAVIAYSHCLRVPQFDALSPIDTNNCSFITKHLGAEEPKHRDLTNEELSDMIVSTGNLRLMPTTIADSFESPPKGAAESPDGPAPWSPLKRLRAESGSLSAAPLASPQFSPIIQPKIEDSGEIEDDVFGGTVQKEEVLDVDQRKSTKKMSEFDDINNSRLPSNSHSAAPSSEQKSFVFPDYPMCRHSSVPSIAHLVGDISDFCPPSPYFADKMTNSHTNTVSDSRSEVIDKTSEEKPSSGDVISA